jgi:5-enolpyruvylshikimate-3-phosphate synthase
LEEEKAILDTELMQKAFPADKTYSPRKLNEERLAYAKTNLVNLLHSEDELWRRDFAKFFAFRAQGLAEIIHEPNAKLAVFFGRLAEEERRKEVDYVQKLADAFA